MSYNMSSEYQGSESDSISKSFCVACLNKTTHGVFKCQGCSQTFCLQHTNEHRACLSEQLEELLLDKNDILNQLYQHGQPSSILYDQIDQWEKNAINQIQQSAQNIRMQIQHVAQSQQERVQEKFTQLTEQMRQARIQDQYLERDLYRWRILYEQLKCDLTILSPSFVLRPDTHQALIHPISIVEVNPQSVIHETLISDSDQVHLDDPHHLAIQCGPDRRPTYVCGTREYSTGEHRIRFLMTKRTHDFLVSFNVMSQKMPMPPSTDTPWRVYGWQSDDCVHPSLLSPSAGLHTADLKGHRRLQIELIIDCDQQKISYFNERSKRTREISVNLEECPLPWKLSFYLYDVGDCVRLLSSSHRT